MTLAAVPASRTSANPDLSASAKPGVAGVNRVGWRGRWDKASFQTRVAVDADGRRMSQGDLYVGGVAFVTMSKKLWGPCASGAEVTAKCCNLLLGTLLEQHKPHVRLSSKRDRTLGDHMSPRPNPIKHNIMRSLFC
jgi:hypothetical protein